MKDMQKQAQTQGLTQTAQQVKTETKSGNKIALFGFKLGWTIIALIGYGIFAGIRKGNGKEDAYDGKLRILPKYT